MPLPISDLKNPSFLREILDEKNEDWKEMGPKFEELRRKIRLETSKTVSEAEIEYKTRHKEPTLGVVG